MFVLQVTLNNMKSLVRKLKPEVDDFTFFNKYSFLFINYHILNKLNVILSNVTQQHFFYVLIRKSLTCSEEMHYSIHRSLISPLDIYCLSFSLFCFPRLVVPKFWTVDVKSFTREMRIISKVLNSALSNVLVLRCSFSYDGGDNKW